MVDELPGQPGHGFTDLFTTPETTELPSKKPRTAHFINRGTVHKNNGKHDSPALPVGGRLSHLFPMWIQFTTDEWSLEIVSQVYVIKFRSLSPDRFLRSPSRWRPSKHQVLHQAIHHLLQIHAVEWLPKDQRGTGVNPIFFVVPKKNGEWRSILDLKYVNQYIHLKHFHMELLKSIVDTLQPGEYMTSLDLTEAYLHVPNHPSDHRFLRYFIDGIHLQFKALPFGLSTAPTVFTKLLVNPVAYLRQQGLHLHPYLDDLLIRSASYCQAIQDNHGVPKRPRFSDQSQEE